MMTSIPKIGAFFLPRAKETEEPVDALKGDDNAVVSHGDDEKSCTVEGYHDDANDEPELTEAHPLPRAPPSILSTPLPVALCSLEAIMPIIKDSIRRGAFPFAMDTSRRFLNPCTLTFPSLRHLTTHLSRSRRMLSLPMTARSSWLLLHLRANPALIWNICARSRTFKGVQMRIIGILWTFILHIIN